MTDEQLKTLVEECASLIAGARVQNVHQSPLESVSLSLYSRVAGKLTLFFCLHPGLARFHLVPTRPVALPAPPPFCQALRKHLKGAHVEEICVGDHRRSVRLRFRTRPSAAPSVPLRLLVFEIRGNRGKLTLLNERDEELQSLDGVRAVSNPSPESGERVEASAATPLSAGEPPLPPLHAEIAALYVSKTVELSTEERRAELRRQIRRALAKRERLLSKIRQDVDKLRQGREAARQGELLKAALGRVRRGMRSIELENYFDPGLGRVVVELDPALSPVENVQRYFKRYKKSVRGLPIIESRLERLTAERRAMEDLAHRIDAAETIDDLRRLESEVKGFSKRAVPGGTKKQPVAQSSGPRRFVSADGVEILVGRSAAGNDELTFRLARGNDLFLHVSGRPGSHVIVRTEKGRPVPHETLLDAAHLALYYSLRQRSRGQVEGVSADIDYGPAKYVRKPKGAPAGHVLMASHKTLRVRLETARLERLLGG